jgi:hypothetical protein
MRKFKYHNDPSHGWLAVKIDLLDELELIDRISVYSYIKGKTAYLEEDSDCTLFVEKYRQRFGTFEEESLYYDNKCPVRSYNQYRPETAREILNRSGIKNRF